MIKYNGIQILSRKYEFFFFTTSNLRNNSIWLIDSNAFEKAFFKKLNINNKEDLYKDLGLEKICPNYSQKIQTNNDYFYIYDYNQNKIQNIISNLSLNFSSTIETLFTISLPYHNHNDFISNKLVNDKDILNNDKSTINYNDYNDLNYNYNYNFNFNFNQNDIYIEIISDLKASDGSILSDGCGKISENLLRILCLNYNNNIQSTAIQIRFNFTKGVLVNSRDLTDNKIIFTNSMIKNNSIINNKLEIISFSSYYKGGLNKDIILLLLLKDLKLNFFLN